MVEVESYLRGDDGSFTPLGQVGVYVGKRDYVSGAIELTVDGVKVLTRELLTDVNWLWIYLVQTFEEFRQAGSSECYFPDRPIKVKLEPVESPDQLKITVETSSSSSNQAVGSADEIYQAIAEAGLAAFAELDRFYGGEQPAYEAFTKILKSWNPAH